MINDFSAKYIWMHLKLTDRRRGCCVSDLRLISIRDININDFQFGNQLREFVCSQIRIPV